MLGRSQEESVALAAGRAGVLAALVALAIGLAVIPSFLALTLAIAGPLGGPELHTDWLGPVLQSLNVVRLGAAAGLLLSLPLLRGER